MWRFSPMEVIIEYFIRQRTQGEGGQPHRWSHIYQIHTTDPGDRKMVKSWLLPYGVPSRKRWILHRHRRARSGGLMEDGKPWGWAGHDSAWRLHQAFDIMNSWVVCFCKVLGQVEVTSKDSPNSDHWFEAIQSSQLWSFSKESHKQGYSILRSKKMHSWVYCI